MAKRVKSLATLIFFSFKSNRQQGSMDYDYSSFTITETFPDDLLGLLHELTLSPCRQGLLGETIEKIARQFIFYPSEHDFQYKLLTAYICLDSRLHNVLPHLVAWSEKPGSGKSTVPKLIAGLRGSKLFQGATTTPAIRNAINSTRFERSEDGEFDTIEKACFLLFDDIDEKTFFRDNLIMSFLKCSYSRQSEVLAISKGDGTNIEFHTFCPKVLSTIKRFWDNDKLVELRRRVLVLIHSQLPDDLYGNYIDIDYISFSQFDQSVFLYFWENKENLVELRSAIRKFLKISPKEYKAYIELMAVIKVLYPELSYATIVGYFSQSKELLHLTRNLLTLTEYMGECSNKWTHPPKKTTELLALSTLEEINLTDSLLLSVEIVDGDKFLKLRSAALNYGSVEETSICSPQETLQALGFRNTQGMWYRVTPCRQA